MKYLRYAAIAWLVLALFQVAVFAVTGMWRSKRATDVLRITPELHRDIGQHK